MHRKSLPVAEVHVEFTSFLDEITPRRQLIQEIGERVIKTVQQEKQSIAAQRQRRRTWIGQLNSEINELVRMRAQNLITNEEFIQQKNRLVSQRLALESQAHQTTDLARVQADLEQIIEPLSELQTTWKALKPPLRSRFDRLILPGGFLTGRIRTADLGLLFNSFRASATGLSTEVALTWIPPNPIISEIHEFREVICAPEAL